MIKSNIESCATPGCANYGILNHDDNLCHICLKKKTDLKIIKLSFSKKQIRALELILNKRIL